MHKTSITVIYVFLNIFGNHDMHASYFLSCVIQEHFRNDKFVTVDNSESWDKAILWGKLLIGFTHHGDRRQVAVVNSLPQLWPDLWAKSLFREWHTGHLHKKEEVKYTPVMTAGGVIIRRIPALSFFDKWHFDNRFIDAVPAGEAFLLNKNTGVEAHYTSNVIIKKG